MTLENKIVGVISLGCDKNRVDTEKMMFNLKNAGVVFTNNMEDAEILIINTCAFLETSREESIDTILECAEFKKNKLEKLIVSGCLPQKYVDELYNELPEVDIFLGFLDYDKIVEYIIKSYSNLRINAVGENKEVKTCGRVLTTPEHYAYLKVADGCNNRCSYCLIPSIRGKFTSMTIEDIILEAKALNLTSEFILVAQDLTRYGVDIYGKCKLVELLQALSKLENVKKIRLLYCYPDRLTDDIINEIKNNDKIIKYIDIPLQHASDKILKAMNRAGSYNKYLELITKLKNEIPEIAIRSTFITGFPNESEEDFEILCKFIKEAKLCNAGFFKYSREEGTPSASFDNQIDESIKEKRLKKLFDIQKLIARNQNEKFKNQVLEVICDGIDYEKNCFIGRAYFNCPDIDGKIYFHSDFPIKQGETYNIKINKIDDYDLYGGTL